MYAVLTFLRRPAAKTEHNAVRTPYIGLSLLPTSSRLYRSPTHKLPLAGPACRLSPLPELPSTTCAATPADVPHSAQRLYPDHRRTFPPPASSVCITHASAPEPRPYSSPPEQPRNLCGPAPIAPSPPALP